MHTPFEKQPNYSHQFISPADTEYFQELRELVNKVDEKGVDLWFEKNKAILTKVGKNNLAKAIGNSSYYFSIQSSTIISRAEIEQLTVSQQLILLKHFKMEQQLTILTQDFDLENPKVFELMYKTAKVEKNENKFYQSRILLDPIFKLFKLGQFDKCRAIEKAINKNIDDLQYNMMVFSHLGSSSFYSKLDNQYRITDEIILNYTDEKKEFILSRNKELPKKEIALQLLEDINKNYKDRDWMSNSDNETIEIISSHIDNYLKVTMFFNLDENLTNSKKSNKNNKI